MTNKNQKQKIYWELNKEEINRKRRERYNKNPQVKQDTYLRRLRWQRENPEAYQKQTERRKNKRLQLRFNILKRDNFSCAYCGAKSTERDLHIDHIIPKSKGGLNIESNLITACAECNIGKSDVLLT